MTSFLDLVIQRLKDQGQLEAAGGEAYVRSLPERAMRQIEKDFVKEEHLMESEVKETVRSEMIFGHYVRLYLPGDAEEKGLTRGQGVVLTNHVDVPAFLSQAGDVLVEAIDLMSVGHWVPSLRKMAVSCWMDEIFEIACKLKGYKAEVHVEQVVWAGESRPDETGFIAAADDSGVLVRSKGRLGAFPESG